MSEEQIVRLNRSLATAMAALEQIAGETNTRDLISKGIAERAIQRIQSEHSKTDATLYWEEQARWKESQK